MRRLGASNADCLWTRRWVESFFRYCAKKRTAPDRGAAIDWLCWQKSKEGDERSEWRYQQAKTALANYFISRDKLGQRREMATVSTNGVDPPAPSSRDYQTQRVSVQGWAAAGKRFKGHLSCRKYSPLTVDCYVGWARRFFVWCKRQSVEFGRLESEHIRGFLEWLAGTRVSAGTQNQALNALVSRARRGSCRGWDVMCCGIRSRHWLWAMVRISGPYRSCWGTRT